MCYIDSQVRFYIHTYTFEKNREVNVNAIIISDVQEEQSFTFKINMSFLYSLNQIPKLLFDFEHPLLLGENTIRNSSMSLDRPH